jgi:hypothetical protein
VNQAGARGRSAGPRQDFLAQKFQSPHDLDVGSVSGAWHEEDRIDARLPLAFKTAADAFGITTDNDPLVDQLLVAQA